MLPVVIAVACLFNVVAFSAFGIDKWKAARRKRRIPEATLLWLAVPASAPGAWFGMGVFRHKTRKISFQLRMVLVTAVNVGLYWLGWKMFGS